MDAAHDEIRDNPLFTMVDSILWLSQVTERNSVVRKLQVLKLRGQASVPGLHTIRITDEGLQAFSRTLGLESAKARPQRRSRLSMGISAQDARTLEILYLRPLDLSVDETMLAILDAIKRVGAKRVVIDSLVGFEMALAPSFRADFRESLYRMIGALTGAGITILSTVEVEDNFTSLQFSHYAVSFLTDDIIRLRYVEIDGQLRKTIVVIKMRGGNHSKDIREYVINEKGVVVIEPRSTDYSQLSTGLPDRTGPRRQQEDERPPEPKARD
jgi:circadian clock protein KaiC